MRNLNLINDKIEHIESKLKVLEGNVKRSEPLEEYINNIRRIEEILQEIKDLVKG